MPPHRWYAIHTVILQNPEGKYYRVNVAYGLTEDQEIEPFSDDSVCFEEVVPRAILTIQFRGIACVTSAENIRVIHELDRIDAAQLARDLHDHGPN